jgi:hypothetical protein
VSSPQVSNEGPRVQYSPQSLACWEDQGDDVWVLDEEKIESLDQDNLRNIGTTSTSISANKGWIVVIKKKKSHATYQPMVTRIQAHKLSNSKSSSPTG